ncbi:hypothetical protein [Neolewinella litorea]|uniref:Uncharacterized protein n=1 Tax=Neolewinella litorea TaxID=2562452 RepID=A0A4S4NN31_9BACT|nr:hypothetical protein [Neolewinella litorea]THH39778.1 hypothetical protein E4021_09190 [Neolewinella litorea]
MTRILLLLLLPLFAGSQESAVPLVLFARGEVTYSAPEKRPINVYTGTYLAGPGQITVAEGAGVEIGHRNCYIRIEDPGTYALTDLLAKEPPATGFLKRFIEFVRRGFDQSATDQDLERAYLSNQGNSQGNVEGFGDAGLAGLKPFGGTLCPEPTPFTWPAAAADATYRVRIVDSLTDASLLSVVTKDTSVLVDLGALDLRDGGRYFWEVFPQPGAPARLGRPSASATGVRIRFTYREMPCEEVLADLRQTPFYRDSTTQEQRQLLEVMVLEEEGYLYAADRLYQESIRQSTDAYPLRRNYAAFLARWNQRSAARDLIHPR